MSTFQLTTGPWQLRIVVIFAWSVLCALAIVLAFGLLGKHDLLRKAYQYTGCQAWIPCLWIASTSWWPSKTLAQRKSVGYFVIGNLYITAMLCVLHVVDKGSRGEWSSAGDDQGILASLVCFLVSVVAVLLLRSHSMNIWINQEEPKKGQCRNGTGHRDNS